MKTKKLLSLFFVLITIISSLTIAPFSAFAGSTVEDGVVIAEGKDASGNTRFVYYPAELKTAQKKYPLIVWANGTGCKPSNYTDMFKGFVKKGFVIVASNETMPGDGTDQIASLNYILNRAKKNGSVFFNKINTNQIAAIGHSQGGESAVNAAVLDSRICCAVSIAGCSYQEEAEKLKTPTLFFTGTSDWIVSSEKWVIPAYKSCKGPAVYASLKGGDHTACWSNPDDYVYYSVQWIKAWANNDRTALKVFMPEGRLAKDSSWQDVTCKNLTNNNTGSVSLSNTKYTYNGKTKKPAVTVRDYRGRKISSANYTVSYAPGRKNVGKYKVTIKYKENYSGTVTKYFRIVPKATSVRKVTATEGGFKASWYKRTTQTTGYQLQRAKNSKFTSGVKTYTITKCGTTSKSISKLSKGKKYYVRVRTYKTVDGKKYYSSWSAYKSVTTKK